MSRLVHPTEKMIEPKFCMECGYSFEGTGSRKHSHKILYVLAGIVFVLFVLWLYLPSTSTSKHTSTSSASTTAAEQSSGETQQQSLGTPVEKGKPFQVDYVGQITIQDAGFTSDVVPTQKNSFYTHYKAENGKVYFYVTTTLKNLGKEKADASKVAEAKVIYDAGYQFDCMAIIEKHGDLDGALYRNIDPLNPETMRYIVQVPAGMQNDGKPLKVQFSIGGKQFVYTYR